MLDFFGQLASGIRDAWTGLSARARINIGVAAAFVLVLMGVILYYGTRPEFVLLYDGLTQEDSIAIRTYLEEQAIPFRVEQNGARIEVPHRVRGRVMLALSDQGVPERFGTVPGFDLFDEQDFMSNRFLQDVQFMRAVQGRLQNTLNALEFVDVSHVMIREAPETYFTDQQRPSEASVVLDVNRRPTDREVDAMLSIIDGFGGDLLDRNNITLVTTDGAPLYLPPKDQFVALAGSLQEHKLKVEQQREAKLREHFERAGINAIVHVAAKVNRESINERSRTSTDGALLSSMRTESSLTTTESLPEGPAGATANPPQGAQAQASTETTENTDEVVENFEPTIVEKTVTSEPGDIVGYSVSALISGGTQQVVGDDGEPTGELEYRPLTDEEIENYKTQIAKIVDPTVQPDDVYVADLAMETELAGPQAEVTMTVLQGFQQFLTTNGWLIVQIAAIVVGFLLLRRQLLRVIVPTEDLEEAPEEEEEAARIDAQREMLDRLERAAQEEPEMFASMLRTWMSESEQE